MLQFVTQGTAKYSIVQEVEMALKGGCKWIQLRMDHVSDEEFRRVALEIIPLCQENDAFLVFEDRIALVMEMKVHGLVLCDNSINPLVARENLGAEAIIGCTAASAEDIQRLKGFDVDYVLLGPLHPKGAGEALTIDDYKNIISNVRDQDILLPIVAAGGVSNGDIPSLLDAGVNGVIMGDEIVNDPDPVSYTREAIRLLNEHGNS